MTSFENVIRKQLRGRLIYAVCAGVIIIVALILKLYLFSGAAAASDLDTGWSTGVLAGLFVGVEVSSFRIIRKYRRTLKNPEALEALHIQEADERNRVIVLRTCRAAFRQTLNVLGLAVIVSAFLSQTVFWTLIIIIILIVVLYYTLFAYYSRKY